MIALDSLAIFHHELPDGELQRQKIEALESNRIDPKFLYGSPRLAELWRQVFFKHSPVHGNPEFTRIYREAFATTLDSFTASRAWLVGLGCGTGKKEAQFQGELKARGQSSIFSAVDVSHELVRESVEALIEAGAEHRQSLVCDLQSSFLKEWLDREEPNVSRLLTFFGIVPNIMPSAVGRIFRAVLRPGDVLLVSAHLAPIRHEGTEELAAAMKTVLPQYDNPETLAWITAGLEEWGLADRVDAPEMMIGELEGMPAFLAHARWKSDEAFEMWGHRFAPRAGESLRLFYSLRYTSKLFEDFLRREGFEFERLSITACKEEAIWSVRCRS